MSRERLVLSFEQLKDQCQRLENEIARSMVNDFRSQCLFVDQLTLRDHLYDRLAVEMEMLAFFERVKSNEWATPQHFFCDVISQFYYALELHCAIYERPTLETLCTDTCLHTDHSIFRLCRHSELYGCVQHGTVHMCTKNNCSAKITTQTQMHVCLFSGYEIGRELSQVASIGSEYRNGSNRAALLGRAAFNEASEHAEGTFTTSVTTGTYTEILKKIAQGEEIALRPPMFDHTGRVRQATRTEVRSFRFDSFISRSAEKAEHKLVAIATSVIDDILFNKDTRDLINIQNTDECRRQGETRLRDYHKRMRSQGLFSDTITSAMEWGTPFRSLILLPLVDTSDSVYRRNSFVRLCISLWKMCHRVRPANTAICTFVQFSLAILFMQKNGYSVARRDETGFVADPRRFTFVPADPRLLIDLPEEKHVDMFGSRSAKELRDHVTSSNSASVVGVGTGTATAASSDKARRSSLFKEEGLLKKRKSKIKARQTAIVTGNKQMTMQSTVDGPRISVKESEVLPSFLHTSIMGTTGSYEMADITAGRNYLQACVSAIDSSALEAEARSIIF